MIQLVFLFVYLLGFGVTLKVIELFERKADRSRNEWMWTRRYDGTRYEES
jgi:hypothetical protein